MKSKVEYISKVIIIITLVVCDIHLLKTMNTDKYDDKVYDTEVRYNDQKTEYEYSITEVEEIKHTLDIINRRFVKGYENNKSILKCRISDELLSELDREEKVDSIISENNEINLCSDNIVVVKFGNKSNRLYKFNVKNGELLDVVIYK